MTQSVGQKAQWLLRILGYDGWQGTERPSALVTDVTIRDKTVRRIFCDDIDDYWMRRQNCYAVNQALVKFCFGNF